MIGCKTNLFVVNEENVLNGLVHKMGTHKSMWCLGHLSRNRAFLLHFFLLPIVIRKCINVFLMVYYAVVVSRDGENINSMVQCVNNFRFFSFLSLYIQLLYIDNLYHCHCLSFCLSLSHCWICVSCSFIYIHTNKKVPILFTFSCHCVSNWWHQVPKK